MRKDPLKLVKMLADIAELEKSQHVASSLMRLSAEKQRLALLEQYLAEYQNNIEPGASVDVERVRSTQGFVQALTKAVDEQGEAVDRIVGEYQRGLDGWRAAKAHAKTVDEFDGRRVQQETIERTRREQHGLDESTRWKYGKGDTRLRS